MRKLRSTLYNKNQFQNSSTPRPIRHVDNQCFCYDNRQDCSTCSIDSTDESDAILHIKTYFLGTFPFSDFCVRLFWNKVTSRFLSTRIFFRWISCGRYRNYYLKDTENLSLNCIVPILTIFLKVWNEQLKKFKRVFITTRKYLDNWWQFMDFRELR